MFDGDRVGLLAPAVSDNKQSQVSTRRLTLSKMMVASVCDNNDNEWTLDSGSSATVNIQRPVP